MPKIETVDGGRLSFFLQGGRMAYSPDLPLEREVQKWIDAKGWRQYMYNKEFRFMPELRHRARWVTRDVRGVDEEDVVQDLYIDILAHPNGGLWKFQPETGNPLEGFFKLITKRRAETIFRDEMGERSRMPTTPIMPAKDEDNAGGISEETLGGFSAGPDTSMELQELMADFREWLSGERLGATLLRIYDVMMEQALEDPEHPLRQMDLADRTGMSTGQINHYLAMIIQSMEDFAEDEPEMQPMLQKIKKFRETPREKKGPATGTWNSPVGPVPVVIVRKGVHTVAIKRQDGQPWADSGQINKNVPKSQVEF